MNQPNLTHIDRDGAAAMVDVSGKPALLRQARAAGFVSLQPSTIEAIQADAVTKGSVLAAARLAGIQAAKLTWQLIPLCHQLPLSHAEVDFSWTNDGLRIEASAQTLAGTGVEMEALTAVTVAALTVYDMCKAIDTQMTIGDIRLLEKTKRPLPA